VENQGGAFVSVDHHIQKGNPLRIRAGETGGRLHVDVAEGDILDRQLAQPRDGTGIPCPARRDVTEEEIAVARLGALVAAALLLLKLLPFVPGSFGMWEYVSFLVWLILGALLWRRT